MSRAAWILVEAVIVVVVGNAGTGRGGVARSAPPGRSRHYYEFIADETDHAEECVRLLGK